MDHYAPNEESMLDYEGNMMDREYRKRHCKGLGYISTMEISQYEAVVDSNMLIDDPYNIIDSNKDSNSMVVAMVSSVAKAFTDKAVDGKMSMGLGATGISNSPCNLFLSPPPVSNNE